MSKSAFQQGAIFETEGKTFQLIRKFEGNLWQAEESRTKRMVEFTVHQLRSFYAEDKLRFFSDEVARVARDRPRITDFKAEQWEEAKVRRAYVKAILTLPNTRSRIIPAITETWQKLQLPRKLPDPSTVIRWKNKLLRAGEDVTALIEQSDRKGNRRNRYPKEIEEFVQRAIEAVYLHQERGTIQETLDRAKAFVERENELRPTGMTLPLPTRRLVKRLITAIPAYDRYAARHGRVAATKHFRAVQAHRTTEAPLERAEMDHTRLDLMVIDDKNGMPLGRPWFTACIDDHSRCILGINVSFEPPSDFTVARCLKHAFLPKVLLRQEYPDIKNEWDAHGVMRELVVDNGAEFHSTSLENACLSLGIEIHYSARKTPWFKGKIERFMGTLNRAIAHGSPGTTFQNIFDKEEYDPSKHAVVRYSVLKEIVYTWIADVYHQKSHRTIEMPPAAMWAKSISPEEILVPDDRARLDAILGRSEQRVLTHKGIEIFSLQYNSPQLAELRRELGGKLNVEIRVDRADIGKIIVFSPDKRQMFTVAALEVNYASGLSEWQHGVCKRFAARENKFSPAGWLEAKARIADLIDHELGRRKRKTSTRIARYLGDEKLLETDAPSETPVIDFKDPKTSGIAESPPSNTSDGVPVATSTADSVSQNESRDYTAPKMKFKAVLRERNPQIIDSEDGTSNA
jgi:putative transposase